MVNMECKIGFCSLLFFVACAGFAKSTNVKPRFPSSIKNASSACESFEVDCSTFKSIVGGTCATALKIEVVDLVSYISKADAVDEVAKQFNSHISDFKIGKSQREVLADTQLKFRQCAAALRVSGDQYSF